MNQKEQQILKMYRTINHIPQPTRRFEIGEKVLIEDMEDSIIKDKLFNGLFYEVSGKIIDLPNIKIQGEKVLSGRYGRIPNKIFTDFFPWFQIYKNKEGEEGFFNSIQSTNSQIMNIRELLNRIYFNGVDFEPEYQRELVWEIEDKVKLINSIIDGVNIGLFVFSTLGPSSDDNPLFEIVDGKQRLSTIKEFYEDKFLVNGLKFSSLHRQDKKKFLNYLVETVNLGQKSKKEIIKSFLVLNRSGKKISEDHMQYVQDLYDKLQDEDIEFRIKKVGY